MVPELRHYHTLSEQVTISNLFKFQRNAYFTPVKIILLIATAFCTCNDVYTPMACAKICIDRMTCYWFIFIWNAIKSEMKIVLRGCSINRFAFEIFNRLDSFRFYLPLYQYGHNNIVTLPRHLRQTDYDRISHRSFEKKHLKICYDNGSEYSTPGDVCIAWMSLLLAWTSLTTIIVAIPLRLKLSVYDVMRCPVTQGF